MTPERIEFARALELVCRRLNPPHRPLPAALSLAELGLANLRLAADDPLLAYRYLRGLDVGGPLPGREATNRIWALEPALPESPTVVAELAPGLLAVGDEAGFVRLLSRRGRGRWEAGACVSQHPVAVGALLAMEADALLTVGIDGGIRVMSADGSGGWRSGVLLYFGGSVLARVPCCRLADGSALVAPSGTPPMRLSRQPSGDWLPQMQSLGQLDAVALAPFGDGFAVASSSGAVSVFKPAEGGGWASQPLTGIPPGATDVQPWVNGGLAVAGSGGEVTLVLSQGESGGARPPQRLSSGPIRALRRLGEDGLVTFGDGGQLRLWRRRADQFERVAEFDATRDCIAPLCDGRVVYADRRGLVLAAPDGNAVWRSGEGLAAPDSGLTQLAAIAPDRVAFVDRSNRLYVLRIKGDGVEVEGLRNETTSIVALAAPDPQWLVYACTDGQLRSLAWQFAEPHWQLRPLGLPTDVPSSAPRLAGAAGRLLCVWPEGTLRLWRRDGTELVAEALPPEPAPLTGTPSALALSAAGHCAVASGLQLNVLMRGVWSSWTRPAGQHEIVGLRWIDDDELMLFDASGQAWRVQSQPWQESSLGGAFGVRMPDPAFVYSGRLGAIYARSGELCSFDQPDPLVAGMRAAVRCLDGAGDTVFAAADALYVAEPTKRADGRIEMALRRIVVTPEVALVAMLDGSPSGRVTRVRLRRRGSATWGVRNVSGKALADDPLLQSCIGLVAADGTLADLGSESHAVFNPDLKILTAEDPG